MPQQCLDRSNVITVLEQMSSKTGPECMGAVMAGRQGFVEAVEEFRFLDSLRGSAWMAYRCTRTGICGTSLLHGFLPFLKEGIDYHLLWPKSSAFTKESCHYMVGISSLNPPNPPLPKGGKGGFGGRIFKERWDNLSSYPRAGPF
jgi:hypothetical protein